MFCVHCTLFSLVPEEDNPTIFAKQITLKEYEVQKRDFTKAAVENLMNSEEYQRRLNTCSRLV